MFKQILKVFLYVVILLSLSFSVYSGETIIPITSEEGVSSATSPAANDENPYAGVTYAVMNNKEISVYTFENNQDVIEFYSSPELVQKYGRGIKFESREEANEIISYTLEIEEEEREMFFAFSGVPESNDESMANRLSSDANSAIQAFQEGDDHPLLNQENKKILIRNEIYPTDNGEAMIDQVNILQTELNNCQDNCQDLQNEYDNLIEIVEEIPVSQLIESGLSEEQIDAIQRGMTEQQCSGAFMGTGWLCRLTQKQTLEDRAIRDELQNIRNFEENFQESSEISNSIERVQNLITDCRENSNCNSEDLEDLQQKLEDLRQEYEEAYFEEYNSELSSRLEAYFSDNSELFEEGGVCANEISNECLNQIEENCEGNEIGCSVARELYDKTQVETGLIFDVVSAIANPDQDALRASKLFGIEADYSNVPKFLRESAPSQICLAKIDGYLDSNRETDVAGAPGLTRYGCQNTAEQVINYETGLVETAGAQNCLQVLGDIRAQRTPITPDFTTAITYSAFIRAPIDSSIKYTVVLSYRQDGTEKIVNLFEDLENISAGDSANEFDNIRLPINESAGEVSENSFQIGLFSFLPNGERYIALTTPVLLIQEGDYFKSINKHQQGGDSTGNSSSSQEQDNDLNWDDVEDSISFGGGG